LPNGPGRDRRPYQQEEWEPEWVPSEALMTALRGMPLAPGADRNGHLAQLEPRLVEEALATLGRLEGQRGLSEREKTRAGALRMLLNSIQRVR
jgi:hypothetical protein